MSSPETSPSTTTIKVSKKLRDRISTGAAERHQTVHNFLENVLDEHDRRRRLAAVAAAYTDADDQTLQQWRTETDDWEAIDTDAAPGGA